MTEFRARAIALYLPQYHPIPENDAWWGTGFTEWTNVTRARRLFPGHRQPHLPADLGFYDLRLPEAREAQAELAAAHGIEGFCYWHYWFGNGRRLLERPLTEVVRSGRPAIGFCVGWANETWSGVWHGASERILVEQTYPGVADARAHFEALLPAFRDARYLTVGGRPILQVYRPGNLPNARSFVDLWQDMARRAGLPGLYLVAALGEDYDHLRATSDGFDAGYYQRLPFVNSRRNLWVARVRHKLLRQPVIYRYASEPLHWPWPEGAGVQPCVVPNWDNTPRCGRDGIVLTDARPEHFRVHVRDAIERLASRPAEERLLWVKSWNEWAEGNYLEPDQETGRARLEVLREELVR
nr:lipopolysaccharide biosynthesis protein [Propionibacterium sp.]